MSRRRRDRDRWLAIDPAGVSRDLLGCETPEALRAALAEALGAPPAVVVDDPDVDDERVEEMHGGYEA